MPCLDIRKWPTWRASSRLELHGAANNAHLRHPSKASASLSSIERSSVLRSRTRMKIRTAGAPTASPRIYGGPYLPLVLNVCFCIPNCCPCQWDCDWAAADVETKDIGKREETRNNSLASSFQSAIPSLSDFQAFLWSVQTRENVNPSSFELLHACQVVYVWSKERYHDRVDSKTLEQRDVSSTKWTVFWIGILECLAEVVRSVLVFQATYYEL
jgi:hypothetical protein